MLGVLAAGPAALGGASFQGLGDLPGGNFESVAYDVAADGSVVVGWSDSSQSAAHSYLHEAFRWTASTGMVGLGDLPEGDFDSIALAVSADGSLVVGGGSPVSASEAFRWTQPGGMVALGLTPDWHSSVACGVSADGSVVVGSAYYQGWQAFHWTQGTGMVGLGGVGGEPRQSFAQGVSADGSVVVGYGHVPVQNAEAFRWTQATGMVGLGYLCEGGDFGRYSAALGVSADGSVVVGTGTNAQGGREAFRWTQATGMVGLGYLPGEELYSEAYAVSADGSVVVGGRDSQAFIWHPNRGMCSLQDLLANESGLDLTGWALWAATGVSADGLTLVGTGRNPQGQTEAWRATLPAHWSEFTIARKVAYLGSGLFGYTVSIDGHDGQLAGHFVSLAFQGADGAQIQQMQAPGEVDVDSDADAEACHGLGDPPYNKYRDSYFLEPFPSNPAGAGIVEGPNAYLLEADTDGGHPCEDVGLAYIVCSGDLAYAGLIGRLGVDYDVSGVIRAPLPGDANGDGCVDGLDYNCWSLHYQQVGLGWEEANYNSDTVTDGLDYNIWSAFYGSGCEGAGQIPEPAFAVLVIVGLGAVLRRRPNE